MIPRIYLPAAAANSDAALSTAQSRHLFTVLRLSQNSAVVVFDGKGNSYSATLTTASKQSAVLRITDTLPPSPADVGLQVHVGQLMCAPAKMDWAVEKMTELGCAEITPLYGEKTRYQAAEKQRARWQRLIIAATEQCGRATLPNIGKAKQLREWCTALPADGLRLVLSPRAEFSLMQLLQQQTPATVDKPITIVCGGESGISPAEEANLQANNFYPAHLGARILRAETAALAALAIIGQAH